MKIKYILIIYSFLVIISSCVSSKREPVAYKPKPTSVIIQTEDLLFIPNEQMLKQSNNVEVSISPRVPRELDSITQISLSFDGNYYKKRILSIIEKIESTESIEKEVKSSHITLIHMVDLFCERGNINRDIALKLISVVYNSGMSNDTKVSNIQELDKLIKNIWINPYRLDEQRYYSVFSVKFKNNSANIQRINIDNFILNSGLEEFYPIKTSAFEKVYQTNTDKLLSIQTKTDDFERAYQNNTDRFLTVQRINMPDILILPPNSEVIKYLAFSPINPAIKRLELHLLKDSVIDKVSYSVERKITETTVEFESFSISAPSFPNLEAYVVFSGSDYLEVSNNKVFIPKTKIDAKYSVYGVVSIPNANYKNKECLLVKCESFIPSQNMSNHIIKVEKVTSVIY